jgi:hypothetical protein
MDILGGRPCKATVRTVKSDELFQRSRDEASVISERLLKLAVFGKVIANRADDDGWRNNSDHQRLTQTASGFDQQVFTSLTMGFALHEMVVA